MASAALAQSSYRIAKSWQYQERLPDLSPEDISTTESSDIKSRYGSNMQGKQIHHYFARVRRQSITYL